MNIHRISALNLRHLRAHKDEWLIQWVWSRGRASNHRQNHMFKTVRVKTSSDRCIEYHQPYGDLLRLALAGWPLTQTGGNRGFMLLALIHHQNFSSVFILVCVTPFDWNNSSLFPLKIKVQSISLQHELHRARDSEIVHASTRGHHPHTPLKARQHTSSLSLCWHNMARCTGQLQHAQMKRILLHLTAYEGKRKCIQPS